MLSVCNLRTKTAVQQFHVLATRGCSLEFYLEQLWFILLRSNSHVWNLRNSYNYNLSWFLNLNIGWNKLHIILFLDFFFLMWTIFKVFIEFITILLLVYALVLSLWLSLFLMLWFFGCNACWLLAPWPGIELAPPALGGEVLTTGPPGKFQLHVILNILLITEVFSVL